MKFNQWLQEKKHLTMAQYKAMNEWDRYDVYKSFERFNAAEQQYRALVNAGKVTLARVSAEEEAEISCRMAAEVDRYRKSATIGGIDERGNYTALHHRRDD